MPRERRDLVSTRVISQTPNQSDNKIYAQIDQEEREEKKQQLDAKYQANKGLLNSGFRDIIADVTKRIA